MLNRSNLLGLSQASRSWTRDVRFKLSCQVRGKKKIAKKTTIPVFLLQDVPGYGPKGAIVPLAPSLMRNVWFPKGYAEYATLEFLRKRGLKDKVFSRQRAFMADDDLKALREQDEADVSESGSGRRLAHGISATMPTAPKIDVRSPFPLSVSGIGKQPSEQTKPAESADIINRLVPSILEYHRRPVNVPAVADGLQTQMSTKDDDATSTQSATASRIHGSVSVQDVLESLKAVLNETDEGRRVTILAEQIQFLSPDSHDPEGPVTISKIKDLGKHEIVINLGSNAHVRRQIDIKSIQE